MAKPGKSKANIRPGATRVHVYNEGLAVFLYDDGNRDAIADAVKTCGLRGVRTDKYFQELLEKKAFAALMADKGLVVAYELQQDDEVEAEVAVGPPLTEKERAGARWHQPQRARLHLPTGRLCVETGNSLRLNTFEDHLDYGALVEVPPGEYVLTLYRIDWDEMRRADVKKYRGPQEFILLTPAAKAEPLTEARAMLDWPTPPPDQSWIGDHSIAKGTCEGKVWFWDFWDFYRLNLDPAAAATLGLRFGMQLRVEAAKRKYEAVYLDRLHANDYCTYHGKDNVMTWIGDRPEVALCYWDKEPETKKIALSCLRVKATAPVPEKYHETWIAATMTVLPKVILPIDHSWVGQWTTRGGDLIGQIVTFTDQVMTCNLDARALETIQAKPGDRLLVQVGGARAPLYLAADARGLDQTRTQVGKLSAEATATLTRLSYDYLMAGDKKQAKLREKLRKLLVPPGVDPAALGGYLIPHWSAKGEQVLRIEPLFDASRYSVPFTFGFKARAGAPMMVRKTKARRTQKLE